MPIHYLDGGCGVGGFGLGAGFGFGCGAPRVPICLSLYLVCDGFVKCVLNLKFKLFCP